MKKPLTFGKAVWASALGVLIVSVVFGLVMFIMMIAMVLSISNMSSENLTIVKPNSVLVVDLGNIGGDRTASGLRQAFSESKTVGLIDAAEPVHIHHQKEQSKAFLFFSHLAHQELVHLILVIGLSQRID